MTVDISMPNASACLYNLSSKLKLTIRSNPNIRKLVTNPLLCAMVCALHRDRFTHLPSEKTKLYEACINMFLRRDLARNILIKDYVSLGIQQKIVLLQKDLSGCQQKVSQWYWNRR